MIKSTLFKACGVAFIVSSVAIANAQVSLAPGASGVSVPNLGTYVEPTFIALQSPVSFTGYDAYGNPDYTAVMQSGVAVDATTHDLDFYYGFINTSTSGGQSVFAISLEHYAGFTTNVSQSTNDTPAQGISSMGRSGNGDIVSALFFPSVGPGTSSTVLEIDTNATSYTIGSMSFIDGGVAAEPAYVPSTPEPAPFAALGLGMIGLIRRRAKK